MKLLQDLDWHMTVPLDTFNVKPDMVCFGKIIGAGMPVGAYGG